MADSAVPLQADCCPDDHRANFVAQMRVVPGPVALICSADGDERTGMAATAWNSLCAEPPMLLVCVNRKASANEMIVSSGRFSVNLLSTDDVETVAIFSAQRGLSGAARFLDGQWDEGELGQPMLKGAVAVFECELEAKHSHGTHDIFIGRVRHMTKTAGAEPLLYMDGGYCTPAPLTAA